MALVKLFRGMLVKRTKKRGRFVLVNAGGRWWKVPEEDYDRDRIYAFTPRTQQEKDDARLHVHDNDAQR